MVLRGLWCVCLDVVYRVCLRYISYLSVDLYGQVLHSWYLKVDTISDYTTFSTLVTDRPFIYEYCSRKFPSGQRYFNRGVEWRIPLVNWTFKGPSDSFPFLPVTEEVDSSWLGVFRDRTDSHVPLRTPSLPPHPLFGLQESLCFSWGSPERLLENSGLFHPFFKPMVLILVSQRFVVSWVPVVRVSSDDLLSYSTRVPSTLIPTFGLLDGFVPCPSVFAFTLHRTGIVGLLCQLREFLEEFTSLPPTSPNSGSGRVGLVSNVSRFGRWSCLVQQFTRTDFWQLITRLQSVYLPILSYHSGPTGSWINIIRECLSNVDLYILYTLPLNKSHFRNLLIS